MTSVSRLLSTALALVACAGLAAGLSACNENAHDDHGHDHDDHAHETGDHGDHAHDDHDHDGDGKPDHAAGEHVELAEVEIVTPSADYAHTTCVVMDEDLPPLAERSAIKYEGREIQFCCELCIESFRKDPAKYVAKLGDK